MQFASQLGMTYGGKRDLYQVLGYKKELTYQDYYRQYCREDIAKVVVDKVVKGCWTNKPTIKDESKESQSEFERSYDAFVKQFNLYSVLSRLDKLLGLGLHAVLFLGFDDNPDFQMEVSGTPQLKYLKPYSCESAKIVSFDQDKTSERYGLPLLYEIQVQNPSNYTGRESDVSTQTVRVHYTRVLHVVEDPLDSLVFGTPRMEALFNRLQDVQKILGANAEMFWRNASPGRVATLDKETSLGPTDKADLQAQFDEYDHNLRRWLRVQGMTIEELSTNITSPKDSLDAQLNVISIVTGIPKRILMGSERGELASSQDEKTWNSLLNTRMTEFCEPEILRPLINRLIELKYFPEPTGEFSVDWPNMSALGEAEKALISKDKMEALAKYLSTPGATEILPVKVFLRDILNLKEDTINEIEIMIGSFADLESQDDQNAALEEE
jgi:hypothetical protein